MIRRFFLKLFRRHSLQQDLEAELAFHREMASASGNPVSLGNTSLVKEQALDLWRFTFVENLWRDLIYAARGLRRSPGFVASAVLSLALGIGVNATMFSLAVEFLFSRPSISDPDSIVSLQIGGNSHAEKKIFDMVLESKIFANVIGENIEAEANWNDGSDTRPVFSVLATKNYFTVGNSPMAIGRGWTESDPDEVAVLAHQFWRRHLNGDPSVIGRAINLDGRIHTILGVLPENHRTLFGFGFSPDVYLPRYGSDSNLMMFARLKPDMSLGEAKAALLTVTARLPEMYPERWNRNPGATMIPVAGIARIQQDRQVTTLSLFFALLLVITGLVLFIACVNVANLLLARASARRQEIAVRLSLGATRRRLLQQLLSESSLLALMGTGAGLLLAYLAAKVLASIPLPLPVPIRLQIEPDWRVIFFASILALVATIFCGLLPALQSIRDSISSHLHRDRKLTIRRVLVAGQIAVSVIVLSTGFLFLRNLLHSSAISPGFDIHRTLRAQVRLLPESKKNPHRISLFVNEAIEELKTLPGIEAAAAARIIPFNGNTVFAVDLTFQPSGEKKRTRFNWNAVSPDYFRAMEIPIYEGRPFSDADAKGPKVVLVNRTFAQRYLGSERASGIVFSWDYGTHSELYTIIGVVGNTKNMTIGEDDRAQMYQPLSQINDVRSELQFVVRSSTPPGQQIEPVRRTLRQLEPTAGLEVKTLYSSLGLAFLPSQIGAALLGSIGVLGLLLAAVGLYGVLAYSVVRRTREIGVRVAVGANRIDISRMVFQDSVKLIAAGSAFGLIVALMVTRPLAMFFVPGLSPRDPLTFTVVLLVLAATGLLAAVGPVRRALSIDPISALRYE